VRTCPKCGAENTDASVFCSLCASRFPSSDESPIDSKEPARDRPTAPPGAKKEKWSSLDELIVPSREKRRMRRLILAGSFVVSIGLIVLAVVFIYSRIEKAPDKPATFTSKYSGLSFSYPSSWEIKDRTYIESLMKGKPISPTQGNEVILLKRGSVLFKYMLIASTEQVDFRGRTWYDIESTLQDSYHSIIESDQAHDLTFFRIKTPAGTNGFGVSYYVTQPNESDFFHQEAFILKGNVAYTLLLITPLKGGGSDDGQARLQLNEILSGLAIR
jgi:hypothetical protein